MPFNLLLLPLIGGYLLVSRTHLFAFKAAKQSGERLIFMSALAAVLLVIAARTGAIVWTYIFPSTPAFWSQFSPVAYSGTALLAMILGAFGHVPINWFIPLGLASKWAIEQRGSGLDRLLYTATEQDSQILVTLDTGKVYAGWLDWTPPNPGAGDAYIRVLPTISGHRTSKNQIEWTTFYQAVYLALDESASEAEIESFTKVIPISRIVTIGLFDPGLYNKFGNDSVDDIQPGGNDRQM